jgi:hypothetical protein
MSANGQVDIVRELLMMSQRMSLSNEAKSLNLVGGQAQGDAEGDMTSLKAGTDLLDELIGIRSIQRRRRTELKYDRLWCQVLYRCSAMNQYHYRL